MFNRGLSALLLILSAIAVAQCGSGATTLLAPTSDQRCGITLAVANPTIDGAGGAGTATLTTARECQWSIASTANWLTVTSPASGQGESQIAYTVSANRSSAPRTVDLVAGTLHATISQQAWSCSLVMSPVSLSMGARGGEARVTITTEDFCSWTLQPQSPWISVASTTGTGTSDVVLRIAENVGGERRGTVKVGADQTFNVTQSGPQSGPAQPCTYALSRTSDTVPAAGGPLTFGVTAPAGCAWEAASNASWMRVQSGGGGTQSGEVVLTIDTNTGAQRSGTVTAAGIVFSVTQHPVAPVSCSFAVSPLRFDGVSASASPLEIAITTSPGCLWAVTDLPSWMSASPASSTGPGKTTLNVQANTGSARAATVTVATRPVPVNQVAAPAPCSYSISSTGITNVPAAGSTTQVSISTAAGCAWTVTGTPAWIGAIPAGGTGPGNTSIAVQANSGVARSVTLVVAGKNLPVNQVAAACTYSVDPTSLSVPSGVQTKSIVVTTQTGCPVSAATNENWMHVTTIPFVNSGTVLVLVEANQGKKERNGDVTITGQAFTRNVRVDQSGKDD